ncbi:MAG: DUF3038 domain-containing protein, partial [Cyanobacteria bacterium J06628_3]
KRLTASSFNLSSELSAINPERLLAQLLFCTGTAGMQRFWISLFDGEVE